MSIGYYKATPNQATPYLYTNQGVPNQPGGFSDIDLQFRSECVLTEGVQAAPTCSYDFQMEFCRDESDGSDIECLKGSFAGCGRGPGKIKITGGTDDFLGAFGQVRLLVLLHVE